MVISGEGAIDDLWAERADRVGNCASECWLMQRDRPIGKVQEAMIKPEKASGTLRFALSADISNWRVQRDEQREHFASKTLVESEVAADSNDLVIRMGSHNEHTLFLGCSQLGRHSVRETVNPAKQTRRRPLEHAIEVFRSLHFRTLLIQST
jgi:hypothetical protein